MRPFAVAALLGLCASLSAPAFAAPKKKKPKTAAAPSVAPEPSPQPSPSPQPQPQPQPSTSTSTSAPVKTGAGSAADAASVVTSPSPSPSDADVGVASPSKEGARSFSLFASGGMVVLGQSFHSNGEVRAGRLDDYRYTSGGAAVRAGGRVAIPLGSIAHIGIGGAYQYAGATGTRANTVATDGSASSVKLSLESHAAALTVGPGVHVGGVDIDVEAGPVLLLNYIGIDSRAPLPSDRTIGLFTGLRVDAPSLIHAGNRLLGLSLEAGSVELAQHDQTANLEDGESKSSRAMMGHVEIGYGLFPESASTQLAIVLGYHGSLQTSRYEGPSVRNGPTNGNATSAERVQETHVSSLGLRLSR